MSQAAAVVVVVDEQQFKAVINENVGADEAELRTIASDKTRNECDRVTALIALAKLCGGNREMSIAQFAFIWNILSDPNEALDASIVDISQSYANRVALIDVISIENDATADYWLNPWRLSTVPQLYLIYHNAIWAPNSNLKLLENRVNQRSNSVIRFNRGE